MYVSCRASRFFSSVAFSCRTAPSTPATIAGLDLHPEKGGKINSGTGPEVPTPRGCGRIQGQRRDHPPGHCISAEMQPEGAAGAWGPPGLERHARGPTTWHPHLRNDRHFALRGQRYIMISGVLSLSMAACRCSISSWRIGSKLMRGRAGRGSGTAPQACLGSRSGSTGAGHRVSKSCGQNPRVSGRVEKRTPDNSPRSGTL